MFILTHSLLALSAASATTVDPIIVTGTRSDYGARSTATGTRTSTEIRDIPQALTVISEAQIEDQQLRSVADLLYFVPGATPGTGEGNRDQMTLRGNNSTADFFIDGVRDDVQYFRDFYNVERVEVLKGPNAMIFGRGGGGGVVNRVLKRSNLSPARQLTASGDGFGGYRLTGDLDQPLGSALGARLNAIAEDSRSFRRHVDGQRYGINPTLAFAAGPGTRIDLGYERFHDRRVADRGIPADGGRPLKGFRRTFFGDPDQSAARVDVNLATLSIEQDFGGGITLRNHSLAGAYQKFYQNIYPTAFSAATGLVTLGAYNSVNDRTNAFSQTDLIWNTRLAGIEQTLLLGFEIGREKSRNHRMTGSFASGSAVPVGDPTVAADVIFGSAPSDANNRTRASVAALYVQDQIRLSRAVEIVAGLRFDRFTLKLADLRASASNFSRRDNLWSPRLGLIAKPTDNISLYAGYSRSFLPQSGDQFSGLTAVTDALKPERFDNLEVGAKWAPVEGLLATAALYRLDRTNTQARDVLGNILLTGATRSKGLELGLERSIAKGWLISGGYAWQKAAVRKATSAAPAGREVPLVPRHTFSLWNRYDVSRDVGVGLGIIARTKSFASISNHVVLAGYARVDAAVFYKLPRGMQAQINVENLLGSQYFPTAHNDNNIAPGAPRTIKATLGYNF
ncbi:MAG: TonB-dependent siderophore receptor [Sphingomicrobium sp.]